MNRFSQNVLAISLLAATTGVGCDVPPSESEELVDSTQSALTESYGVGFLRTDTSGAVDPAYSYNSSGNANTVQRTSTGFYTVKFPGIGAGDSQDLQVTAYGIGTARCLVHNAVTNFRFWTIRCVDAAGNSVDSRFTASFNNRIPGGRFRYPDYVGYLFSGALSAPAAQYNSTLATNSLTFLGAGSFRATFPNFPNFGLSAGLGLVEVTNGTADGGQFCKAEGWGGPTVVAKCFWETGAPIGGTFQPPLYVRYTNGQSPESQPTFYYAYADDPSNTARYTPFHQRGRRASGAAAGSMTILRSQLGAYVVTIPSVTATPSTVHVTSAGATPDFCKISGWSRVGSETQVSVYCYRVPWGGSVDSHFTVSYSARQ